MIVEPGFLDHWKTRCLIQRLNDPAAPLIILRLWGHCQSRKTWVFENLPDFALCTICGFSGKPETLLPLLIELRFIDTTKKGFIVHDWELANRMLVSAWTNGVKGGRPTVLKTDSKPTGYQSANRSGTDPSNPILSNLVQKKVNLSNGLTDSEYLARLVNDKTYAGINVRREHGKMLNWCKANQKMPTRRRFVNWLNRVERPMGVTPQNPKCAPTGTEVSIPERFKSWIAEKYPEQREAAMKWQVWREAPDYLRREWWQQEQARLTPSQ